MSGIVVKRLCAHS